MTGTLDPETMVKWTHKKSKLFAHAIEIFIREHPRVQYCTTMGNGC